ncbi:MAG: phosphoglucosamine mutase [Oscillospiraceae bacterium]|nr:phosphoglucosamine mutase [Oscillospiraceae bacterium]
MTIGKRIAHIRKKWGISQEELAEALAVSRQSVSKWEMDKAVPALDKILLICDMFCVSADELLREQDDRDEAAPSKSGGVMHKYFGTDGFRGEANIDLTSEQAYKVGRFLGWYCSTVFSGCCKADHRPKFVIGKDTRRSSYMLEYSIVAGLTASGADVSMLHVITTPGVSYVTRKDDFDCGIMITASHNPYFDNGIKLVNRNGEKMDDKTLSLIEAYLDGDLSSFGSMTEVPLAKGDKLGCIVDYVAGRNRYVGYLISLAANSYRSKRIGLDCANGSSWMIAKAVFDALGAQTYVIGNSPDGLNINRECGSTHIEALCRLVKEQKLDMGFAFDGDADRCIAVDEKGCVLDGDKILYILAMRLKARGMLHSNAVVATIMSNSGLDKALRQQGISCVKTTVGDRFIYECMQENGYSIGGEQSGHIILKKYATTGDGLLTAIMLAEEVMDSKQPLSALAAPVKLFPQHTKSISVKDKTAAAEDADVSAAFERVNKRLGENGRALLRQSGTEAVVRIMVECEDEELCGSCIAELEKIIRQKGFSIQ